jgi:hypothetical protein
MFPIRQKFEIFSLLCNFRNYVATRFFLLLQAIQMDNGHEFHNRSLHDFFTVHRILLWLSCPYTSPQKGKSKSIMRTVNDIVRILLFQASMPPKFWVKSLRTATYLLNRLPSKAISASCHFFALFSILTLIYAPLVACVILTLLPLCLISCRIVRLHVSFSGIPLTTMAIVAWISSVAASSSHDM